MSGQAQKNFPKKNLALLLLLAPLIIPLVAISLVCIALNRGVTYLLIWLTWLPQGKNVLFVSSESPVWQQYMAEQILPLVKERAIVLNWSERSRWPWWSFPAHVFRTFAGTREFNPLVLVFRPLHRKLSFRFFRAFRDWKHGDPGMVDQLRRDLMAALPLTPSSP
ncbi:MAG TPA: hypothetical protein VKW06_08505 [Candidatus Angelobacter sp.]|nr:hypothetical protein [Candidatus Angelobacter sp.]